MTFSRYPINKDKDKHFYNDTDKNITIDLLCFKQWLLRVKHILRLYTFGIGCEVDNMRDVIRDIMNDASYY